MEVRGARPDELGAVRDVIGQAMSPEDEAYGVPEFYPRFGFAPVLPSWKTSLLVKTRRGAAALRRSGLRAVSPPRSGLRAAARADLEAVNRLYEEKMAVYPCSVRRGAAPW